MINQMLNLYLNFSNNLDIYKNLNLLLILVSTFSCISTMLIVPVINKIGIRYSLYDYPDARKIQKKSLVRIGGLAIFIGYLLGLSLIYFSGNFGNIRFDGISLFGGTLLITSSAVFFLGITDDLIQLSPKFRLISQFLIASFSWTQGIRINQLDFSLISDSLTTVSLPSYISFFITIFWVVAIINALNWMDGLDGLASGLVIISCFSYLLIEYSNNVISISFIISSILGTAIAFIFYNYNPAKILMGDGGSYFFGYNLAIISFLSSGDASTSLKFHVPTLVMFVPILDMIYVISRRIISGNKPFKADRTHIHHRLINSGLNERQTVRIILSIALITSTIALVLENILSPIFIYYSLIIHCLVNVKIREFIKRTFC